MEAGRLDQSQPPHCARWARARFSRVFQGGFACRRMHAAEMSADLARLGIDNGALQQDMGRKRQRLDGQEQAPAMGRALYQEYLLRRAQEVGGGERHNNDQ